ncbi:MAG: HD domain-containing protein [Candidatus Thorarchaeota archaeon]
MTRRRMKPGLEDRLRNMVLKESEAEAHREWTQAQPESKEPLYNYRFDHVAHVVALSTHLAKEVGADIDIVRIAAWLHDIAKPGMGGVQRHGKPGAKRAREVLEKENLDKETIDRVCDAIEKHVGLTLEAQIQPIEAQVLWDADKLTKLGMFGAIHFLVNGIKINPGWPMTSVAKALRDFMPIAERIKDSMNTKPGKRIAEKRLSSLKTFSELLDEELSIEGDLQ